LYNFCPLFFHYPDGGLYKLLTKKRKLKTGETLWQALTPHVVTSRKAPIDRFYDVVIIGGGVSGALASVQIIKNGGSVLLVDRRAPGHGSTSASTALIQWEIDEPLISLSKKVGMKNAISSYKAAEVAVRKLAKLIKSLDIDCDMKKRPTLLLAGTSMGEKQLRAEVKLRQSNKLPSIFLTQEVLEKRFGFLRDGAIYSTGSLELDPVKLTKGLLKAAQSSGVEIVSPVDVTHISSTKDGVFLTLDEHTVIAASKLVVATGYESLPQLANSKHELNSTWALATKPLKHNHAWPQSVLVWEASDPYLYFRTTADQRIVVGGEDESFQNPLRRDAKIEAKSRKILMKLQKILGRQDLEIDFKWAGTFATTPTGLPVIGPVPDMPNVFAILGAGGNGITFSMIASDLAWAWIKDMQHPSAKLFAPN
jgi:glycine/D-amino acid oxidase-like deaminating enzyme